MSPPPAPPPAAAAATGGANDTGSAAGGGGAATGGLTLALPAAVGGAPNISAPFEEASDVGGAPKRPAPLDGDGALLNGSYAAPARVSNRDKGQPLKNAVQTEKTRRRNVNHAMRTRVGGRERTAGVRAGGCEGFCRRNRRWRRLRGRHGWCCC